MTHPIQSSYGVVLNSGTTITPRNSKVESFRSSLTSWAWVGDIRLEGNWTTMNSLVGQFRPLPVETAAATAAAIWPSSFASTSSLCGSVETSATKRSGSGSSSNSGLKIRAIHCHEMLKAIVHCSRIRESPAREQEAMREWAVAARRVALINSGLDWDAQAMTEQVRETRERPEHGFLTRRTLLALPTAAASATLFVSPSSAAVTVENRAPAGNFLLRTFGIGDPDIFYPRFFEGTWNCYSTLIAVETPQGESKIDVKSVEQSRKRLGYTTTYQARFVPFEGYVVCDRLFTTVSLVESIIGKNTVVHGTWDPRQPNRLELVLKGGAKVENTVTKRSAGMFSPYEFESAEFSRQVLDNFSTTDGPPTVKASQNLTRYQWDIEADEVSKIEAIQKVSMYAVPKEGKDLEIFNSTEPITIYKYRVTFERQGL